MKHRTAREPRPRPPPRPLRRSFRLFPCASSLQSCKRLAALPTVFLRSFFFPVDNATRCARIPAALKGRNRLCPFPKSARWFGKPISWACRCTSAARSEEHTSELQSLRHIVCGLLLAKKKNEEPHQTKRPASR